MFGIASILEVEISNILIPSIVIEIIHTSSILHDDVIDKSNNRRGEETLHSFLKKKLTLKKDAVSITVLLADAILFSTFRMLVNCENDIKQTFYKILFPICMGEIKQDYNLDRSKPFSLEEILNIAKSKTGELFALSFCIPAMIKKLDLNIIKIYKEIGYFYGIMYQIFDDLEDLAFDTLDTTKFNHNQLKQWNVISIIWRKLNPNSFEKYYKTNTNYNQEVSSTKSVSIIPTKDILIFIKNLYQKEKNKIIQLIDQAKEKQNVSTIIIEGLEKSLFFTEKELMRFAPSRLFN